MKTDSPPVFLTAEWRYLAMLNYVVNPKVLAPFVPAGTELDSWAGKNFVSVVGFRFLNTRVLRIPLPFHRHFEEVNLPADLAGERRWLIKENEEYKALFLDGNLIDIVLPPQVVLQVADTAPPSRGGVDTAWKTAKLETGLELMVPLFINKGENIKVDTVERKYAGKSN